MATNSMSENKAPALDSSIPYSSLSSSEKFTNALFQKRKQKSFLSFWTILLVAVFSRLLCISIMYLSYFWMPVYHTSTQLLPAFQESFKTSELNYTGTFFKSTSEHTPSSRSASSLISAPKINPWLNTLVAPLLSWDGEYFILSALHNTTYYFEKTHAFFPGFPMAIMGLNKLLPSFGEWIASFKSQVPSIIECTQKRLFSLTISGALLNNFAFVAACIGVYYFVLLHTTTAEFDFSFMGKSDAEIDPSYSAYDSAFSHPASTNVSSHFLAFMSSYFFAFTAASVHMSAAYTESLFACFSIWGFNLLKLSRLWQCLRNRNISSKQQLFSVSKKNCGTPCCSKEALSKYKDSRCPAGNLEHPPGGKNIENNIVYKSTYCKQNQVDAKITYEVAETISCGTHKIESEKTDFSTFGSISCLEKASNQGGKCTTSWKKIPTLIISELMAWTAVLLFALGTLVRSNGILFTIPLFIHTCRKCPLTFYYFRKYWYALHQKKSPKSKGSDKWHYFTLLSQFTLRWGNAYAQAVCVFLPFALCLSYGYTLYCKPHASMDRSVFTIEAAKDLLENPLKVPFQVFFLQFILRNPVEIIFKSFELIQNVILSFVLPFDGDRLAQPSWCSNRLPNIYSHVQRYYWDVSFMGTFTFKRLYRILYALPFYAVCALIVFEHFTNPKLLKAEKEHEEDASRGIQ